MREPDPKRGSLFLRTETDDELRQRLLGHAGFWSMRDRIRFASGADLDECAELIGQPPRKIFEDGAK